MLGPWSFAADQLHADVERELTQALVARRASAAPSASQGAGPGTVSSPGRPLTSGDLPLFTSLLSTLMSHTGSGHIVHGGGTPAAGRSCGAGGVPGAAGDVGEGLAGWDAREVLFDSAAASVAGASADADTEPGTRAAEGSCATNVLAGTEPVSPGHPSVTMAAASVGPSAPLTDSEQLWLEAEVDAAMRFANTELLTGYLFDPRFAFSFDKGLLLLGKSTMAKLNVTVVHVSIPG